MAYPWVVFELGGAPRAFPPKGRVEVGTEGRRSGMDAISYL